MPLYLPPVPTVPPAVGVKGRADGGQPSVPIGVAFVVDWLGPDDFNSGGLHPIPSEFVTDREGLWLFDVSLQLRPMPQGATIDRMIFQLEADGQLINETVVNSNMHHFPSLTYKMPAGVRMRAVCLAETSASLVLIDAGWRTYFSMTFLGTT